jgi:hypothetical protein
MYNNDFRLDLNDIDIIEASLIYRLKRLSARREKVKKNLSINRIDCEINNIHNLLGRLHNQKEWYRPKNEVYISG